MKLEQPTWARYNATIWTRAGDRDDRMIALSLGR